MARLTAQEIETIRKRTKRATSGNRLTDMGAFEASAIVLTEDIPKLLAEVEALRSGIKTAIAETSCDDTWDYLNRLLDGKPPLKLPYRIGGDA